MIDRRSTPPTSVDGNQDLLLFKSHPQPLWVYDLETLAFVAVNDAAVVRYGYSEEQFLRMTIKDIRPSEDVPRLLDNVAHISEGYSTSGTWRHRRNDGTVIDVEISSHTLQFNGRRAELVMALDVTERLKSDRLRSRLQQAIGVSKDVVFMTDVDGRITFVNEAFYTVYGYTADETIGNTPRILKSNLQSQELYERLWGAIRAKQPFRGEFVNRTKSGMLLTVETSIDPIIGSDGELTGFMAIQRDITERKLSEQKLEASELRFRQLAENIQEVFWISTPEKDEMLYVSPAYEEIWRSSAQSLYDRPTSWAEAIHPDDRERVWSAARSQQSSGVYNEVYRIVRPDGSVRWIRDRAFPVKDDRGNVYRITGIAADITTYVEAEKAQHESETRFRTLAMTATAAIFIYGETFTYVNPAAVSLTGYSEEELLRMPFWSLVHPDHRELVKERGQARLSGQKIPGQYEFKIVRKDGDVRWVLFTAGVFKPNGTASAIATAFDITEQKRVEEQLKNSELLYRDLVENSNEVTYLLDRHLAISYISPVFALRTGIPTTDVIGRRFVDLIHPDDVAGVKRDFRKAVAGGTVDPVEFRFVTRSGATLWARASAVPVLRSGKLESIRGVVIDVTQRRLAEEALRVSERRFRTLTETSSSAIFIFRGEETLYVNPSSMRILGYSEAELLSMKFWQFVHPDEQMAVRERGLARQRGEKVPNQMEIRVLTKDGQERWVEYNAALIDVEGTPAVLGTVFDITERRRAQQLIQESEDRYRELFDEALTGNYVSRPDGTIVASNRTFARLFGFDGPEEVLSRQAQEFHANPEARRRFLELVRSKGRLENYENDARRKDGSPIHIVENVVGKFDAQGELLEIHGYVYDNTERKRLEEHIRQSQKMDSIGTLAGGIAHDFNNILGIILGYTQLINVSQNNPKALASGVAAIERAADRGAALVKQLLTFARKSDVELQSTNLNHSVSELVGLLEKTFPKTIEIRKALDPRLPSIVADPTQMHQVLLNLSVNARDAMPNGGTLTFESSIVSADRLPATMTIRTREYVHLVVEDTGAGMDEATKARIFEPFFTTKELGKGTGLGLATVFGIIESHHGLVEVKSAPGRGTAFHLYLPAQPSDLRPVGDRLETSKNAPGGDETILVVEDEEMLQELLTSVLTAKGYQVMIAPDGRAALELFEQRATEIALVLTDFGLPKMNGGDLLLELRRIKRDVKVLMASGFLEPNMRAEMLRRGASAVIAKPYDPNEVLVKIRQTIDAPSSVNGDQL